MKNFDIWVKNHPSNGGVHYIGRGVGETFADAITGIFTNDIYFDAVEKKFNGGEIYGNEVGVEELINYTRGIVDIPLEIEGEYLKNLGIFIRHRYINNLDRCTQLVFDDATIGSAEDLEKLIGRCIINAAMVELLTDMLETPPADK